MKVKNNHDGLLNVAGVDIRAGATAEVDDEAFELWSNSFAAKTWMKLGVIAPAEKAAKDADDDKKGDGGSPEPTRDELFAQARELGLNPNGNTSNAKLAEMIAEASKD